jgi:HAD superfamily hydrolase (TIGR01509 family)
MAVDAIIFDFDGVIIDTETPDYELWREFYESHGLDLPVDLWITRVGANEGTGFDPAEYFTEVTGKILDRNFLSSQFNDYLKRCDQQPLLAGVEFMLQQAKARQLKLAIASSSYSNWVEPRLLQHDLHQYFDCICTRDHVKMGKPAPDLYLKAVECLEVSIERCIAIEDSPNGMKAALAAGLRCIAVPNALTCRLEAPQVSLTIASLAEYDLDKLMAQF